MTVLMIEVSGGRTRRCDATCHNAKRPKCRCICGGQNHGSGRIAGPTERDPAPKDSQLPFAEIVDCVPVVRV